MSDMPVYKDETRDLEERVEDLLSRMTLREKLRQMGMTDCVRVIDQGAVSAELLARELTIEGIGAVQDARLAPDPKTAADVINAIQRYLVEETRLGVPALIIGECLHGHMSVGATVFPQAIGLASMWNPALLERIASAIAREARAVGVNQALAPDLDLGREPRWGRLEETYGEDPYLTTRLGLAYVRGMQGEGPAVDADHLVTTVKHFAAHGSPEGGINLAPVPTGERELRSLYLPPFEATVKEGGAWSVMPAYSELDGVPASASRFLLHRILREEWGFEGYTFSDYGALGMLVHMHRTAADIQEAGRQALEAGMDLEAPSIAAYGEPLLELVSSGEISDGLINRAVRRILRVKIASGVFERPFVDPENAPLTVHCREHRELALEAARESIILLTNRDAMLPLSDQVRRVAVIGPNAMRAQLGDYSVHCEDAVAPVSGIRAVAPNDVSVAYTAACGIYELEEEGIDEAVELASDAQVAVVVVGGSSMVKCGVGWGTDDPNASQATCGEGFDRTDLSLPGVQQKLVEAVIATGTPTVVVLSHGRPYSIGWIAEHARAVVDMWYAGEFGGQALGEILFGKVNPSGRLPVSVPRAVGQSPVAYNHKPSARGYYKCPGGPGLPGRDYVFMDPAPLFEFGHGLSYTTFRYSDLQIEPEQIAPGETLIASVTVANTGDRSGKEVVQLYLQDLVSSVTTPVRALRGLQKVCLEPGESATVPFELGFDDMKLLDESMNWRVEPGTFEITVGDCRGCFEVKIP